MATGTLGHDPEPQTGDTGVRPQPLYVQGPRACGHRTWVMQGGSGIVGFSLSGGNLDDERVDRRREERRGQIRDMTQSPQQEC